MVKQKVAEISLNKEKGYLYYLNKEGNVARIKMARGNQEHGKHKPEILAETGITREEGWLYFIDKDGDVSRAKANNSKN